MRKILLAALVAFPLVPNAQNWQFASSAGSLGNDAATAVVVDPTGYASYASGTFEDTIHFASVLTLSPLGAIDSYIAKYSSNGLPVWAICLGGTDSTRSTSIALYASTLYVAGYFTGSMWAGSDTVISAGGEDIFIAALDVQSSNLLWLRRFGSSSTERALDIAAGQTGIAISGFFGDTCIAGIDTVSSSGGHDVLVMKLNLAGNPVWMHAGGGSGNDVAMAVAITATDEVIIGGKFDSPVATFGYVQLMNQGANDLFLACYGANGVQSWARLIYGAGDETFGDLAVASNSFLVVGRSHSQSLDFMQTTLACVDTAMVFLASYYMNGVVDWAIDLGSSLVDPAVAVMNSGAVYIGTTSCVSGGIQITKISGQGIVIGTASGAIGSAAMLAGIALDQNNTVYVTGSFSGQAAGFSNLIVINTDSVGGTSDAYLAKFPAGLLSVSEDIVHAFSIYPNPVAESFVVRASDGREYAYILTDLSGSVFGEGVFSESVTLPSGSLSPGAYMIVLRDENNMHVCAQLLIKQ